MAVEVVDLGHGICFILIQAPTNIGSLDRKMEFDLFGKALNYFLL